ncbi:MAG: aminotransferase class I/II-fold pyridoxal phosphate-dependent enzyme [Candidatus Levybacteria bacterium]|nr:aminotransferase class I/II-fold pyridoxal phosphate-dependent enzyme [Candidatus Levybacteria bacterium]MBI2420825.1 aminotransferase class I/II-fold pyridoxal phosphate-dependent enzyme [Candidatus Levybacteria bacterium]
MSTKTSKRLDRISEYVFSSLGKKVSEIENQTRRKVLNFGPGSPDIKPSKLYIDKFSEFIRDADAHLYPGYNAIDGFAEALINWYKKRFGVLLKSNELLPLLGAKDGISHLPLALLDEGDEVLVPDPGYPAFSDPAILVGAKPVFYNLREKDNFKINLEELKDLLSRKTKFIWVNFPSNPTGQVTTKEELSEIVKFAKKNNIIVVYDNAYSEITFDGYKSPSILEIKGAKEIAVEIGSFSKTFSFAGFRMGWIVGNKDIIGALAKTKSQMDSGLSIPLQRLGAYALTKTDEEWYKDMITNYKKRRNIIAKHLKELGLDFDLPRGSLYIWARIPEKEKNSWEFCMRLFKEKQILLTPGTAFGKNGNRYVRVSICVNIDKIGEYF